MGKHTNYQFPSGNKDYVNLVDLEGTIERRARKRREFWNRPVVVWKAGLFLAVLAALFSLTFWVDQRVLTCENYQMFCSR
jgi:hypothetical protein